MDAEFWHARWRDNRIGFHQEEVNPHLRAFWSRLALPAAAEVLVPLAGKSLDMRWLCEQGCRVLGVEISPIAVAAFFSENGLRYRRAPRGRFEACETEDDGLTLLCGDIFDLDTTLARAVAMVYDRAALIALPPPLRARYARHLVEVLPAAARILLVTLEYDQNEMDGPPFSVPEDEVVVLFGARYRVERLALKDKLEGPSRYKEQGLSVLAEKVFLLTPTPTR